MSVELETYPETTATLSDCKTTTSFQVETLAEGRLSVVGEFETAEEAGEFAQLLASQGHPILVSAR